MYSVYKLFMPGFKNCIILLMISFSFQVSGQELTGKWTGILPQPTLHDWDFKMEMEMVQNGNHISGKSKYTSPDNHWVIEYFTGTVINNIVNIKEYKVEDCNCNDNWQFCIKRMHGTLVTDSLNSMYILDGRWDSDTVYDGKNYLRGGCPPGSFHITKLTVFKKPPVPVQQIAKTAAMPVKETLPIPVTVKKAIAEKKALVINIPQKTLADASVPAKPFDRPLDGYYKKNNIENNRVTPYANIRESDAVFAKRVWEEIDVREKRNQYLASPKSRLIDVLMDAVAAGELTAYDPVPTKDDPNGDSFATPLLPGKARAKMVDSALVDKFDKKTGEKTGSTMQAGEFNPDSVVKFRIKEDWIFDKQRSVFEPRIIGIAPMIRQKVAGLNLDYQPAFWIYFPAARRVLATKEAVNRNNDATGLSFDDVFLKRLFSAHVVKVSNDKDERIKDYAQGIDRLYESQRIKKSLMDWELNLWQY